MAHPRSSTSTIGVKARVAALATSASCASAGECAFGAIQSLPSNANAAYAQYFHFTAAIVGGSGSNAKVYSAATAVHWPAKYWEFKFYL